MKILGVCGSLQANSANLSLLRAAARGAPEGVTLALFEGLERLPYFNPDLQENPPDAVTAWRFAVSESDALLIASPEYGHSLPGVLKNAIDWLIGTGELWRKVVGVTAATASPERGKLGLQALRVTLQAVDAVVVGGEPISRGESYEREVRTLLLAVLEAVLRAR